MEKPQALLIDLDGTLLDHTDRISERAVAAVRAAAERIPVAIASGRVLEDVGHYARMLGLHSPQISDTGARLMDPVTGRTISDLPIEEEHARLIIERLERDDVRYFAVDSGRTVRSSAMFVSWRVTVITCAVPDRATAEEISLEHSRNGVIAIGSRGSRDEWYVNYTHGLAHKGYGALRFSEWAGIEPGRVMAIGDGLNDREMFEAVGMPVAMAHAPEDMRSRAKHVTGTLEEDGVSQAIERFVL